MSEKTTAPKPLTTRTNIKDRSGYALGHTNEDGTLNGQNGEVYQLVPVKSNDCRAGDSKPSTYTHRGAVLEATNQINSASNASCAADQNKFLRRAVDLLSYVISGTNQRA